MTRRRSPIVLHYLHSIFAVLCTILPRYLIRGTRMSICCVTPVYGAAVALSEFPWQVELRIGCASDARVHFSFERSARNKERKMFSDSVMDTPTRVSRFLLICPEYLGCILECSRFAINQAIPVSRSYMPVSRPYRPYMPPVAVHSWLAGPQPIGILSVLRIVFTLPAKSGWLCYQNIGWRGDKAEQGSLVQLPPRYSARSQPPGSHACVDIAELRPPVGGL